MDRVKYAWCKKCVNKPDSKPMNVNFKIKSFTLSANDRDGKKKAVKLAALPTQTPPTGGSYEPPLGRWVWSK